MADEVLYARVKPLNVKRGYKVQRIHVKCLGRAIEGGDGMEKPIEWVCLRPDQAQLLRTYRQDDQDPDSKPVFDIVTLDQRKVIDRAEDAARLAGGGRKVMPRKAPKARVTDVRRGEGVYDPGETAAELEQREQILNGNEQEPDSAPGAGGLSLIAGADSFISDPAVVGRMQALAGLNPEGEAPARTHASTVEEPAEPTAPSAPTERPREVAPPQRRRGRPPKAQAPTHGRSAALPPLEDGVDINDAIGNQPSIDVDADDDDDAR